MLNSVFRDDKYLQINQRVKELRDKNQLTELVYVNCPAKYLRLGYVTWLCSEREGSVLIGVCDLFLKTIDSVKEIEF